MNRPVPSATTLDVTEGCNLACDYCFTHSEHHVKKMSWDMMKRIFDWWLPQTDPTDYRQIGFWGGEPLLEWDLIQKGVRYVESLPGGNNNLEFGGTTNGVLYTEDKVEWGLKHNCLFLVSLDGIEKVHDARRKTKSGKGSWKQVDRNVRKALELFPRQRVRATLSAESIDHFYETAQYFIDDLKVQHFAFSPVYEDDWNEERLEVLAEQFELINNLVVERKKEGRTVELKHLEDIVHNQHSSQVLNPCGAGNKYSSFSYDGYLFPCHRFNKHGVTSEERAAHPYVMAVPDGDSFRYVNEEKREEFLNFSQGTLERCDNCEIASQCQGGCYATNFDMTGDIHGRPQTQCDYQRVLKEAGLDLKKKLDEAGVIYMKKWDQEQACNCYNMCYMEGTFKEIIHSDRQSDIQCLCYNTNYAGGPNDQHRPMQEVRAEKEAHDKVVAAAIKVMGDYENEEGTSNEDTNSGDEQLCGTGIGEQDNDLQHAGTHKCSACRANKTCGEGKEVGKEDDGVR